MKINIIEELGGKILGFLISPFSSQSFLFFSIFFSITLFFSIIPSIFILSFNRRSFSTVNLPSIALPCLLHSVLATRPCSSVFIDQKCQVAEVGIQEVEGHSRIQSQEMEQVTVKVVVAVTVVYWKMRLIRCQLCYQLVTALYQ